MSRISVENPFYFMDFFLPGASKASNAKFLAFPAFCFDFTALIKSFLYFISFSASLIQGVKGFVLFVKPLAYLKVCTSYLKGTSFKYLEGSVLWVYNLKHHTECNPPPLTDYFFLHANEI